jgi:hypothetical protein
MSKLSSRTFECLQICGTLSQRAEAFLAGRVPELDSNRSPIHRDGLELEIDAERVGNRFGLKYETGFHAS